MSVQLSMFPLMMSEASHSATGSPELEAGAKPCGSPDGLIIGPSGLDRRLASHSAPQGSSVAAPTSGTSPHTSPSSSPATDPLTFSESKSPARLSSESLQRALEARLQANLSGLGSMIYSGAWKPHTTPAGRQIYRLRASARRTSASEHSSSESGWPTPASRDGKGGYLGGRIRDGKISTDTLDVTAQMAGWTDGSLSPSPQTATQMATDGAESETLILPNATASDQPKTALSTPKSRDSFMAAGWATPVGQQANGTPERFLERKRESMERGSQSMGISLSDLNMQAQAWAGWTTPQAHDTSGRSLGQKAIHGTKHGCACLVRDANLATWNTPRATDGSHGGPNQAGGALSADAAIAGWKTPCTPNGGRSMSTEQMDATGRTLDGKKHTASLEHEVKFSDGPARLLADGTLLTGFSAEMESGGQLNPRFSGWLMGYPTEWCEAAISCQLATPSRKKAKPTPDAP